MRYINKRLVSLLMALLIGLSVLAPAAGAADTAGPPVLVNAANASGPWIELMFDRKLKSSPVELDKVTVTGASGAVVDWAYTEGNTLFIKMNKPLVDVSSVTVGLAAGSVLSETDEPNAAIAGYKVQTLAGIIGILEAMQATTVNPDVRHVVKYLRTPNLGNVAGGEGIGREDVRFLTSLTGLASTRTDYVDGLIDEIEIVLTGAPVNYPETTSLQEQLSAVKSVRQNSASTLYQLSKATLDLQQAYEAYIRGVNLPLEPKVLSRSADVSVSESYSDIPNRILIPKGMTADQLLASLVSRYSITIRSSNSADAAVITGDTVLASPMVVTVEANGGYVYAIQYVVPVSTPDELLEALSDISVGAVRILNDITMRRDVVTAPKGLILIADETVTLTVGKFVSNGHSLRGDVRIVAYAETDLELRQVMSGLYQAITFHGTGDYYGTLVPRYRTTDTSRSLLFFHQGPTAYVTTGGQLQNALEAEDITRIYLVENIAYSNGVLTFPNRNLELIASTQRTITASGFANSSAVTMTNVTLNDTGTVGPPEGALLTAVSSHPDLEVRLNESTSATYHYLIVPSGTTSGSLSSLVASAHGMTVRATQDPGSAVVTGELLPGMYLHLSAPNSLPFRISVQQSVSTAEELAAAASNPKIDHVNITQDISAPEMELNVVSPSPMYKDFKARETVNVTVRALNLSGSMSRGPEVVLTAHVDDDAELQAALRSSFTQITAGPTAPFTGTLTTRLSGGTYGMVLFYQQGTTAYVANDQALLNALAAPDITTIYLADNISLNAPLDFPNANIYLTASETRTITAPAFTNAPMNRQNVLLAGDILPGILTAAISASPAEGILDHIEVDFSQPIDESIRNNSDLTAEHLLEAVKFFGTNGDGSEIWYPAGLSIAWKDSDTLEISFIDGVEYDWTYILVEFKSGAIVGSSGAVLAYSTVVYPTGAAYLFPWIDNVNITNHSLTSFEIKFSGEVSAETRNMTAAQILSAVNAFKDGNPIPLNVSTLTALWTSKDVLYVVLPIAAVSDDWDYIEVVLNSSTVSGSNGESLFMPSVYYAQLPPDRTPDTMVAEITWFSDIEAVNINIDFSRPIHPALLEDESFLNAIEYVKLVSAADTLIWTPEDTDMTSSGWIEDYQYSINFTPNETLPFAEYVEVKFKEDVVITSEDGAELENRTLTYTIAHTVESDNDIVNLAYDSSVRVLRLTDIFGNYLGVYERNTDDGEYHFTNIHGIAIVYDAESLYTALYDEDVVAIYLADDIVDPNGEYGIFERISKIGSLSDRVIVSGDIEGHPSLSLENVTLLGSLSGTPVSASIQPLFDLSGSIDHVVLQFNQPMLTRFAEGKDIIDGVILQYDGGLQQISENPNADNQVWEADDRLRVNFGSHTTDGLIGITVVINSSDNELISSMGSIYTGGQLFLNPVPMTATIQNLQNSETDVTCFQIVFSNPISEASVNLGGSVITEIRGITGEGNYTFDEGDFSISYNADLNVMTVTMQAPLPYVNLWSIQVQFDRELFTSVNGNYLDQPYVVYNFSS